MGRQKCRNTPETFELNVMVARNPGVFHLTRLFEKPDCFYSRASPGRQNSRCRTTQRSGFFRKSDVDVGMNVRSPAVMPDERRAFHSPDIPRLVAANVVLLIERHMQLVDSA